MDQIRSLAQALRTSASLTQFWPLFSLTLIALAISMSSWSTTAKASYIIVISTIFLAGVIANIATRLSAIWKYIVYSVISVLSLATLTILTAWIFGFPKPLPCLFLQEQACEYAILDEARADSGLETRERLHRRAAYDRPFLPDFSQADSLDEEARHRLYLQKFIRDDYEVFFVYTNLDRTADITSVHIGLSRMGWIVRDLQEADVALGYAQIRYTERGVGSGRTAAQLLAEELVASGWSGRTPEIVETDEVFEGQLEIWLSP